MSEKLRTVLVIGASRGIGFESVKQLLGLKPTLLIATYRTVESANELRNLSEKNLNLKLLKLDLLDFDSYAEFAHQIDNLVGEKGLEILLCSAGILIEDKIGSITKSNIMNAFTTNAIAPVLLTQQLLPALQRSASHHVTTKAVYMSSCLGSIANNDGDRYSHRMSKAALNQGYVRTAMSNYEGEIDVQTSVKAMLELLFSDSIDRNHKLISWDGKKIDF